MQDINTWNMITNQLAGESSSKEQELFLQWLNKADENKLLFNNMKRLWDGPVPEVSLSFRERYSRQRIKDILYKQTLGNFIGFVVGLWVTTSFSHYELERRSLKNLYGLAGRDKVVVNEIPEWIQGALAILIGFITLELINHFFQSKKHIKIWEYIKRKTS